MAETRMAETAITDLQFVIAGCPKEVILSQRGVTRARQAPLCNQLLQHAACNL